MFDGSEIISRSSPRISISARVRAMRASYSASVKFGLVVVMGAIFLWRETRKTPARWARRGRVVKAGRSHLPAREAFASAITSTSAGVMHKGGAKPMISPCGMARAMTPRLAMAPTTCAVILSPASKSGARAGVALQFHGCHQPFAAHIAHKNGGCPAALSARSGNRRPCRANFAPDPDHPPASGWPRQRRPRSDAPNRSSHGRRGRICRCLPPAP